MRLFFLQADNLYKIFKTLEKIPHGKTITIYIEDGNSIFENNRWWKQINDLLQEKEITATFIAKTEKAKKYFQQNELTFEYKYKNKFFKALHIGYLFFFNIKKFRQSLYSKQHYVSYMVFAAEVSIILIALYMVYLLILPSATINISPTYSLQDVVYNFRYYPSSDNIFGEEKPQLSIPYYQSTIEYEHTLDINVSNLASAQTPAKGTISLYNETTDEYAIIPNTRFITNDGLIFTADTRFTIPAQSASGIPGEVVIDVTAADIDIYENVIGERGNIDTDTTLYIKNLRSSYFLKKIYAKAHDNFQWGETLSSWSVQAEDIEAIKTSLQEYIDENKKNVIRQQFDIPDTVLLYFPDLMSYDIKEISVNNFVGEERPTVQGTIKVLYHFYYVNKSDIVYNIQYYLNQRKNDTQSLVNINMQSLVLYDIKETIDNTFIIPTEVTTIQSYNFDSDPNNIKNYIKSDIINASKDEALDVILQYPEITNTDISIRPGWYNQIPTTKSRIFFDIKE